MEQAVKETVYLVDIPKVEKKVVTVEKQYEKVNIPVVNNNITAVDFISKYEGLRLKAYFDTNHFSIGFGTRSFKGEVITKEEAKRRFTEYLKPLEKMVDKECYNQNERTALISYMYNVGKYAMNINKYVAKCDKKSIRYIMGIYGYSSNGKRLNGLVKRRKAELLLFNK